MKQKLLLLINVIICIPIQIKASSCCTNGVQPVAPYLSIRSQGVNTPRRLAGTLEYTHLPGDCNPYGYFSVAVEATGSFNHKNINKTLFGTESEYNQITISGSQVAQRGPTDWLAEYFYLPPDYQSSLTFRPWITNFIVDMDLYVSLDQWWHNTYIALYAPFVHTRWDLGMQECIQNPGSDSYPSTYFAPQAIARNQLQQNFTQYINGIRIPAVEQPRSTATGAQQITIAMEPLTNAQMSCTRKIHTSMAEIRLVAGWDFIMDTDRHMGLAMHLGAPTGNRPTGIFLFEPIIGNGHHWEFGGGFNGHWDFWATEDECTYASFYVDAIVTHLFIATQKRTFDLKGKPFSRYMLTERMDYAYTNTFASNSLNYQGFTQSRPGPNGQFQDEYMPVANITTITVDVGVDVQAELTAFFTVVHNAWSFDVGYNFWARTCDDISLKPNKNPPLPQSFSLKGDAFVFGLVQGDPNNTALELGASESNATIHAGTNLSPSGNTSFNAGATNPNIDNPVPAQTPTTPLVNGVNGLQINTSVDPIYINIPQDLDACASRTSGMSSKLFAHVQYNADPERHCAWNPFFGLGGEVEFAHSGNACLRTNVSQWGVWVKGGIAFE